MSRSKLTSIMWNIVRMCNNNVKNSGRIQYDTLYKFNVNNTDVSIMIMRDLCPFIRYNISVDNELLVDIERLDASVLCLRKGYMDNLVLVNDLLRIITKTNKEK